MFFSNAVLFRRWKPRLLFYFFHIKGKKSIQIIIWHFIKKAKWINVIWQKTREYLPIGGKKYYIWEKNNSKKKILLQKWLKNMLIIWCYNKHIKTNIHCCMDGKYPFGKWKQIMQFYSVLWHKKNLTKISSGNLKIFFCLVQILRQNFSISFFSAITANISYVDTKFILYYLLVTSDHFCNSEKLLQKIFMIY